MPDHAPPACSGRILIIEDNRDLADNIAECLADEGYTPFVTTSAAEALAAASGVGFDVAFLDVRLPDADGTQALVQLKARAPDAEVVVMSGDATLESAIATVRGGAFAYILKPFPLEEVLRLASLAMRQVSMRRERETLLAQLLESELRYRAVVETSPALIVGVALDDSVALVNAAVEQTTGFGRDALLGRPFDELVPSALARDAWDTDSQQELTIATRDGSERRIEWRYRRADGLRYAIGIDVTETRAVERRARVAEHLAVVGELTAGLAHEIRNPLNSALLELKVLGRRLTRANDTTGGASVDAIRGELERLERLLAEFLWFARPRPMANASPCDLSSPAATVARLVQAEAASRSIRVVTDFIPDAPLVSFVEDRIRQVVFNLVRNAIDAVGHDGTITLRTRAVGPHVELQIEDDGPGIDGDANRVFLPFHTTKSNGTGLGLTIAQRIAADHGGELRVESAPGKTVFTLALPTRR
jgi:PAS domain S-box-containing protein